MTVVTLVNQPTADRFVDTATLICPGAEVVTVHVRNAAVLMQLGVGDTPPLDWQAPEIFVPPGDRSMTRRAARPVDGVRFKSAVAGVPAQVSADAA